MKYWVVREDYICDIFSVEPDSSEFDEVSGPHASLRDAKITARLFLMNLFFKQLDWINDMEEHDI